MSWQGKGAETGHVEEVRQSTRPGFGAKVRSHLRKWWWAYSIFFVTSTLIIVLCLVYVAFPRISQNDINDSTLTVTSLVLSNPTPDSFHLVQTALIGNDSPYHPNLDAFNASLALDGGVPYAYVQLPQLHATREATSIVDQDVKIADMDAFTEYIIAVLNSEQVTVDVRGRTALHEMRFPTTTVDYRKTATMQGLNKLNGFAVTNFTIKLTPEPDGTNMIGTISIPNPTIMTISMGNVTFNTYLHATTTLLGTTLLENLTLRPGTNTLPMRATVNQSLALAQVARDDDPANALLPVDVVGDSCVYDGMRLSYFEEALRGLRLGVTLDVGAALAAAGVGGGG